MSNKRLNVGNLPFEATTEGVRAAFEALGAVREVSSVIDRYTGRPHGFGFVAMDLEVANAAIAGLSNKSFGITATSASPKRGGATRGHTRTLTRDNGGAIKAPGSFQG